MKAIAIIGTTLVVLFAAFLIPSLLMPGNPPPRAGAVASQPAAPTADTKIHYLCDQAGSKLMAEIEMGEGDLLKGTDFEGGSVILVVDPWRWERLSLDDQKRYVETFNCALAGPTQTLTGIRVRAFRDGPDLLSASMIDLYEWERAGYAEAPPIPKFPKRRRHRHRRTAAA